MVTQVTPDFSVPHKEIYQQLSRQATTAKTPELGGKGEIPPWDMGSQKDCRQRVRGGGLALGALPSLRPAQCFIQGPLWAFGFSSGKREPRVVFFSVVGHFLGVPANSHSMGITGESAGLDPWESDGERQGGGACSNQHGISVKRLSRLRAYMRQDRRCQEQILWSLTGRLNSGFAAYQRYILWQITQSVLHSLLFTKE